MGVLQRAEPGPQQTQSPQHAGKLPVPLIQCHPHDRPGQVRHPLRTVDTVTEEAAGETITDILRASGSCCPPFRRRQSLVIRKGTRRIRDTPPRLVLTHRRRRHAEHRSHLHLPDTGRDPSGLRGTIRQRTARLGDQCEVLMVHDISLALSSHANHIVVIRVDGFHPCPETIGSRSRENRYGRPTSRRVITRVRNLCLVTSLLWHTSGTRESAPESNVTIRK